MKTKEQLAEEIFNQLKPRISEWKSADHVQGIKWSVGETVAACLEELSKAGELDSPRLYELGELLNADPDEFPASIKMILHRDLDKLLSALASANAKIQLLEQKLEKAEGVIGFYANEEHWHTCQDGFEEEQGFLWQSKFNPPDQDYSEAAHGTIMKAGRAARQYLKERE